MTDESTTSAVYPDPHACPYGWIEVAARISAGDTVGIDDKVVALETILTKINGAHVATDSVKVTFSSSIRRRFEVMTSRPSAAAAREAWSKTTGTCGECLGAGLVVTRVTVAGTSKKTCPSCSGTGHNTRKG